MNSGLYEKDFAEYESNEERLDALKKEYAVIMECLDALAESKELSYYYKKIIVEMSANVVENLAAKYDRVREGVKSVMGGKVLNYEAKTIYQEGVDKGMREGKREGEQIGREQKLRDQIQRKLAKRQSVDQIADALEESPDRIRNLICKLSLPD
ncbi:MAG: hypothetical protein LUD01_01810 [Clostridiales bacterium]|nr:hypothetical protein [Clostridiales bacterium]